MKIIKQLKNHNPYFNMALDEYFLCNDESNEPIFILNQNEPSVIIGNNQNPFEEVNLEYAKENKIKICRRMSGGGAVYHDFGNLSFTFIEKYDFSKTYEYFSKKIIKILNELGIKAEFKGRNDIVVDDQKISGNAQKLYKNKILHHGTLLYSVDLEVLKKVLTPDQLKIISHSTKSNKSRVTLIKNFFEDGSKGVTEFVSSFLMVILSDKTNHLYELSEKEIEDINEIAKAKYQNDSWIYKESITYEFKNKMKFDGGLIELNLNVEGKKIKKVEFHGDFLSRLDMHKIENNLVGVELNCSHLFKVLNNKDFINYFGSISIKEVISLFPLT